MYLINLSERMRKMAYEVITPEQVEGYSTDYLHKLEQDLVETMSTLRFMNVEEKKEYMVHKYELRNVRAEIFKRKQRQLGKG